MQNLPVSAAEIIPGVNLLCRSYRIRIKFVDVSVRGCVLFFDRRGWETGSCRQDGSKRKKNLVF